MSTGSWFLRTLALGMIGTTGLLALQRLSDQPDDVVVIDKAELVRSVILSTPPEAQEVSLADKLAKPRTSEKAVPNSTAQDAVPTQPPAESPPASTPASPPQPIGWEQSLPMYAQLFDSATDLGMLSIGVAEGNMRVWSGEGKLFVQQTPAYFGHTDPGNLSWGERVTNFGPCSDQGYSGGDIELAEQYCVKRAKAQLPEQLQDLAQAEINPAQDVAAVLNTADLYNQASPIHSTRFPQALRMAYQGGLSGVDAMSWARTASFYLNSRQQLDIQNGTNKASGLLGICARQGETITEWDCVYRDQRRRAEAINDVLLTYREVAGEQTTQ
ncbi:MAG: hypothetical protein AAGG02_08150 [Cyanobacteria bacterium P01_H01_bin.15]